MAKRLRWYTVEATDYYRRYQEPMLAVRSKMPVRVRWPDGTETDELLVLREGNAPVQSGDNSAGMVPTRELYVKASVRGVLVMVPLLGLEIRFIGEVKGGRY